MKINLEKIKTVAGYVGIIGLPESVTIICDESMENRLNFEMGSNEKNKHLKAVEQNLQETIERCKIVDSMDNENGFMFRVV